MQLPKGPKTPLLLQTVQWIVTPLEYLENCSLRYGEPFKVGGKGDTPPAIFISHPQAIKEIFTAPPELFDVGRGNLGLQALLGSQSMVLLDGKRHQHQRQLLMPPFHGERVRSYNQVICDITNQVTSQWRIGGSFLVRSCMQNITLRVILHILFGSHTGERFEKLRETFSLLLDSSASPISSGLLFFHSLLRDLRPWAPVWSPIGRFASQLKEIDELIYAEIRERREQPDSSYTDILSLLMSAHDENGQPMTDVEIRDEVMTLLATGHETTSTALTWAFYWIHHLPEIQDKLRCELQTLSDNPEPSEVSRLPYLSAVCAETLRIYPLAIITFPRILKSSLNLMGYQFEADTVLLPCPYLTHHREELYPEPKRFRPERFLERQFSPYEYLPFGGGNRRCIGIALAQNQIKLVLYTILSQWKLKLADSRPVKPVRQGVTVAPPRNMRVILVG